MDMAYIGTPYTTSLHIPTWFTIETFLKYAYLARRKVGKHHKTIENTMIKFLIKLK